MATLCSMKLSLLAVFGAFSTAAAHMEMSWPYPVRSPFNPLNNYTNIDYSYTNPLFSDGSNYPCKGYQNDRPIAPVVTYQAGSTYNMTIYGDAMHGGGSCQLSLSYDNGATFRVIKSIIGGCPLSPAYDFTIPSYAPGGTALLAWTWFNEIGNREMYMNCAEVNIDSSDSVLKPHKHLAKTRRQQFTSFDQLPYIWKANIAGISDCATVEGIDPVFPDPGPDVEYGGTLNSQSPPTPGDCDSPTPYGQTYEDLHDTGAGIYDGSHLEPLPGLGSGQTIVPSAPIVTATVSNPLVTMSMPDMTSSACEPVTVTVTATAVPTHFKDPSRGRIGRPMDPCPTYTITIFSTAAPSTTAEHSENPKKHHHHSKSNHLPGSTPAPSPPLTSLLPTESLPTLPSATIATSPGGPAPSATNLPGFASGPSLTPYLPCVPNTYLCLTNTTYAQCIWTSNTASGYIQMGSISGGMTCQPYSAPIMSTTPAGVSSGGGVSGTYRNDRIVLAEPYGPCDTDGQIECMSSGEEFLICDQGGWVDMGAVALGTTCSGTPGLIGAASETLDDRS